MAPTYTEILLQPSIKDQTCTRVEECAYYDLSATRQLHNEIAASVGSALPELLAELSRLTRERDEAFNAGIEAAAVKSDHYAIKAQYRAASHDNPVARNAAWDKNEAGREIAIEIRALKKPATGQATGEK